MQILNYLQGKRTYIIGAIIFILGGLDAIGYADIADQIYTLLGGLGLITLRASVK
jgi:hypothetical protein